MFKNLPLDICSRVCYTIPMIVKLTDDYMKRRLAMSVPGAWFDSSSRRWMFDSASDPSSTRIAIKLFPDLLAQLPESVLTSLEVQKDFRPYEVADEWAAGRSVQELLPNVPAEITSRLRRYQAVDTAFCFARMKADGGAYNGWNIR